jgi:hypothetical protein
MGSSLVTGLAVVSLIRSRHTNDKFRSYARLRYSQMDSTDDQVFGVAGKLVDGPAVDCVGDAT